MKTFLSILLLFCESLCLAQAPDNGPKTVTASGTNAYAIASTSPAGYTLGESWKIRFSNPNTTAVTITRSVNGNSLGAKAVKKNGSVALASGDLNANQFYLIVYDGTNYQLIGPPASAGGWPLTGAGTLTGTVTMAQGGFNTSFTGTGTVTFSPSATISGMNTGSVATDPSAPVNGDLWHNSTFKAFGLRSDGYTAYLWSDQYENNAFGLRVFDPAKIVYGTAAHNSGIGSGAFLNCTTCKNNVVTGQNGTLTTGSYNELNGLITVFTTGSQNNWSGYDIGPADGTQRATMSLSNTITARNIQAATFLSTDPGYNNNPSEGTVGIRLMPENLGIIGGVDNSSITSLHSYTATNTGFNVILDAGVSPFLLWRSRAAASGSQVWGGWNDNAGNWKLSTLTDDGGTATDKILVSHAGQLQLPNAGQGISLKDGTNATIGTATANGTTAVTVTTNKITANSWVFFSCQSGCGTSSAYYVFSRNAGTSFTFKAIGADTGTVVWWIVEQAP